MLEDVGWKLQRYYQTSTLSRVGFCWSGSLLHWHVCLQAESSEVFEVDFKSTGGAGELVG